MNKKILGILVMTLLIATAVLPVVGTMNVLDNRVNNSSLFSEDKEINKRNHCSLHDHDLEIEWERLYGESNDDLFRNVKQTVDGGYICVGVKDGQSHWLLKVDTNGDEEWSATALPNTELWPRCYIVEQTSDGGFVTAGCHEDGIAWGYDRCIWKVDANGNMQWNKTFGGKASDLCGGMDFTNDGGIIISATKNAFGMMAPRGDGLVIKTDANGNIEWQKTFGDVKEDQLQSLCSTSDGGYIVAGGFTSTETSGAGLMDGWLIKIKAFENNPPEKPSKPSGPAKGEPDTEYAFSTSSTDPDGDQVSYLWDWGDGNFSDWLDTNEATYTWTSEDNFEVRVMAKDEHGGESDWSDPLSFSTPKNKVINTPFLRFLENHPHMFPLLRQLFGL